MDDPARVRRGQATRPMMTTMVTPNIAHMVNQRGRFPRSVEGGLDGYLAPSRALYRRAAMIVIFYALLGGVVGVLIAEWYAGAIRASSDASSGYAVLLAVAGAIIGGIIGNERAFTLRLMAQQALCQVQIERNTRGSTAAAGWANASQVGVPAQAAIPMPTVSR